MRQRSALEGSTVTTTASKTFRPINWRDGKVRLIDQTRLPSAEVWLELERYRDVIAAIKEMRIRGSGAIGCAGAIGAYLAVNSKPQKPEDWEGLVKPLRESRPQPQAPRPT